MLWANACGTGLYATSPHFVPGFPLRSLSQKGVTFCYPLLHAYLDAAFTGGIVKRDTPPLPPMFLLTCNFIP